jgi:16S rRNA pseudouridine516 synthase
MYSTEHSTIICTTAVINSKCHVSGCVRKIIHSYECTSGCVRQQLPRHLSTLPGICRGMRLDLIVSQHLHIKRKLAAIVIEEGRVKVDNIVIDDPSWQILAGVEKVAVDGLELPTPFHRLYVINKLPNVLSTRSRRSKTWARSRGIQSEWNECREKTREIFDCIPDDMVHPSLGVFGRLDKDTTGVLLLGTDGGLQTLLTHPSSKLPKVYVATLKNGNSLDIDAVDKFQAGITMPDGVKCAAADLQVLDGHRVRVTLKEGFYHQVKRMLGFCGGHVVALHREAFGPVSDTGLAIGDIRRVTMEEMIAIKELLPIERGGQLRKNWSRG